jgi:tetratricopeptide (TPR) repeat protein
MKSLKPMLFRYLLLILIPSIATPTIAVENEQWREAIGKDYRKVLKEKKPNKQVQKHRDLVNKWKEDGHLEALISLYETDAGTERANAGLHYGLGYAYANQGRIDTTQTAVLFEKAASQFERTISLAPTLSQAHFSLGAIYQEQNKLELAAQAMEACLKLNPKYYPAHHRLAKIQLQQDNPEAALESFQEAQKMNSKWELPYYGIGLAYFELGNYDAAREALEEVIFRDPKFAPAHFKLGQVLAKEGFFNAAWEEYEAGEKYEPYTTENLHELGTIFVQKGNQKGAIDIFRRIIDSIDPTHTAALLQLAELYYAIGEEEIAIDHYKRAIEAGVPLTDYFMEQLAPYHAGLMGRNEAKSILKRFLAVIPDDPRATFHYAQIEADAGNLTAAIQYYERTLALIGSDETNLDIEFAPEHLLDTYRFLGDAYYQQETHEKARAAYKRTIELDPGLERYFFNQGKSAFDAEQFNLAIASFSKFLLIFPENIDAAYLLGRSYEASGDAVNALEFYVQTLELDANHTAVLMRSAQIYRGQNDQQNALTMLAKLIGIEPTNVEAYYLSGMLYVELERSEEALDAFLTTTRLNPDHLDAHHQIASLYEQQGAIDNTIKQYETIIRLDSSNADPFLRLGALYLRRGDKDNVIRVYEPGLEIEPNHPQAQYSLAVIFEEREDNEKAIKHFKLANRYDDGNFDWHFRYAHLLDRYATTLEDYDAYAAMAVEEYNKTINLKNDYAPAYLDRGLITRRYKQIGDTLYRNSQIAEDFKQVIALEPNNSDAHYYLGMTYIDLDQRQNAKEILLKTLQFKKKYKGVYLELGLIAESEGDHDKAIGHFEKELEIDPESVRIYQRLGDLYSSYSTDFGRAKETLEKALELQPNHVSTLLNYASTLYYLDQLGAATEQFETVIQINPKDLTANYNLALMYEYSGKTQQAISRWKKFLELNPPAEWKEDAEQHLRQLQP